MEENKNYEIEILQRDESTYLANIHFLDKDYVLGAFRIIEYEKERIIIYLPAWTKTIFPSSVQNILSVEGLGINKIIEEISRNFALFKGYSYKDLIVASFYNSYYIKLMSCRFYIDDQYELNIPILENVINNKIDINIIDSYKNQYPHINEEFWDWIKKIIRNSYPESKDLTEDISLDFTQMGFILKSHVDKKLYNNLDFIRRISMISKIHYPDIKFVNPYGVGNWTHPNYTWDKFVGFLLYDFDLFIDNYKNHLNENLGGGCLTLEEGEIKEGVDCDEEENKPVNEYKRVLQTEKSPFIYYPNTKIRVKEISKNKAVVYYRNRVLKGKIEQIKLSILKLIGRFKYLNTNMIIHLVENSYIESNSNWRESNFKRRLGKQISDMEDGGLILGSYLTSVDEDGNAIGESSFKILTLDYYGIQILNNITGFYYYNDGMDLLQDPNTIRAKLAASQWLIFWLCDYKDENISEYKTDWVISKKSENSLAARIYAYININDRHMIAEPIRRVDPKIKKINDEDIKSKVYRLIKLFEDNKYLYSREKEIYFSSRPSLMLVCEDDDHMDEVYEVIKELLEENPDYEVFFTTDLNIYNEDVDQRVFEIKNGQKIFVDMDLYLGVDKED